MSSYTNNVDTVKGNEEESCPSSVGVHHTVESYSSSVGGSNKETREKKPKVHQARKKAKPKLSKTGSSAGGDGNNNASNKQNSYKSSFITKLKKDGYNIMTLSRIPQVQGHSFNFSPSWVIEETKYVGEAEKNVCVWG